jgi:hypothetical protein
MASGKAVIGLGRGGVLESVPADYPLAGFFYESPGEQYLEEAVRRFEREEMQILPSAIQAHALHFSEERFHVELSGLLADKGEGRDELRPVLSVAS